MLFLVTFLPELGQSFEPDVAPMRCTARLALDQSLTFWKVVATSGGFAQGRAWTLILAQTTALEQNHSLS